MQGCKIDRDIYVKPTPEANNTNLWKLHKLIYGLCDASRTQYLRVNEELHKLGENVSKYDKAFYIWPENNKLFLNYSFQC